MHRRHLLQSVLAGVLSTAGCLGAFEPTDTRTRTESPGVSIDGGRTVRVKHVETFTHALRLNDLGTTPLGPVSAVSELDYREREVIEAAIDGTYETSEPPEWLGGFLGGTPYIEREGTYYRLGHTLPTYAITAEAVPEDEVDGEIATYEAYREAVTHDGLIMSGLMRTARDEGIEFTTLWPALREFLDRYDAVRYHGEILDFALSVDDPGAPYTVTATEVTLADMVDGAVWDISDEPKAIRAVVRAAGAESGVYAFNEPPAGLFDGLDEHEYVYLDGTFYTTYVEKRAELPVSLAATFTDADDSDTRIRLALRNEHDGSIEVMSGAPRPFGILYFYPVGDPETSRLLWTDAYEENTHVHTDGRRVTAVNDIGLTSSVPAGGAASRSFSFDWRTLSPGEYVVESDLGIGVGEGGGATFPFRVVFSVE